jgi:pilus assembly protein FimV
MPAAASECGRAKLSMAFNKSKALESALKYLNQGKVAQAIAEYQQILRHDAKDQATLMTVGDLFARQGDLGHAIEYFERLAQVYLNDGFNSKAIAIYKKINKLAPAELPPLERLADLYVQQGVLSEARPLFLQIAEAHLKANRAPKAVEVLHRLLEVEPENLRVQMRLAELYNVMGQKKESAATYLAYAQRLFDRGEKDEAEKLAVRALEVDPTNAPAMLLKAKTLHAVNKTAEAIAILESHPEANAGGEVTTLLLDYELRSGQSQKAAASARKILARGHEHFALLYKVAETLIESGQASEALPLLRELRNPMIEAGEQDKFMKSLSSASERLPGQSEPLEMLVDFCRTTSDPFPLNAALGSLSDAYAAKGNMARAEEVLVELVDRNKGDERIVERLNKLRAGNESTQPAVVETLTPPSEPPQLEVEESAPKTEVEAAPPPIVEEGIDDETQKYIAQALTDVDLFSSYGLTQKATHLLENVLQRAPRHTPTLERLLDLYLGAGNERRTAELAGQLEQIHRERNDNINAERFAELRQRFQKAAGIGSEDLPAAPPMAAAAPTPPVTAEPEVHAQASVVAPLEPVVAEQAPAAPAHAAPVEFEIPLMEIEPESAPEAAAEPEPVAPEPVQELSVEEASEPEPAPVQAEAPPTAAGEELDLSDEWEAISQEVAAAEPAPTAEAPVDAQPEVAQVEEDLAHAPEPEAEPEPELDPVMEPEAVVDVVPEPEPEAEQVLEISAEPEVEVASPAASDSSHGSAVQPEEFEIEDLGGDTTSDATIELIEEPSAEAPAAETVASNNGNSEFELELTQELEQIENHAGPATTEDFLNELAAEVGDLEAPETEAPAVAKVHVPEPAHEPALVQASTASASSSVPPEITAESLNQLAEVFQEFRSELGELGEEDEDLETHYNLGIAYREMGLLDEAIGEFQKVAKAVQKGKPFRYTMNCSAMLGLSFMDKGEPKVASLWYQRALDLPDLEEETVLALRYDLGLALEAAGESPAALDCFRQVYATNIDYRDVADRISTLQKR